MPKKHRLLKRGNTFYYHRRVPPQLVDVLGKSVVKVSLGTGELSKATQLRSIKDVEWDERFRSAEKQTAEDQTLPLMTAAEATGLVRTYVEESDTEWAQRLANDPPASEDERHEMLKEAFEEEAFFRETDNPEAHRAIWHARQKITGGSAYQFNAQTFSENAFVELIRRALLELRRREVARLKNDFSKSFFDILFEAQSASSAKTDKSSTKTFGELCGMYFDQYKKDAEYRKVADKRVDKIKASLELIKEIIGDAALVSELDLERCMAFRDTLSQVPTNVHKHYPNLPIAMAIEKASSDGRVCLSYTTQSLHLGTLTSVLRLAHKLGLLPMVPSEDLTPWATKTHDADKRRPFTSDELRTIFSAPIYTGCLDDGRGFSKPGPNVIRRARFWAPLICLFSGMRANEVCQLDVADVKTTEKGCLYFDANDSGEKKLKNATSKRGVPIHPELLRMGLLSYVEQQREIKSLKLFPELKAGKYGYMSQPLADWFTASFLPSIVEKDGKIGIHSFRHNFRDALRRIEAPDWVLQMLCGWSQSRGVSDNYGSGYTPDQLQPYVEKITYPGLDLSHLHIKATFVV